MKITKMTIHLYNSEVFHLKTFFLIRQNIYLLIIYFEHNINSVLSGIKAKGIMYSFVYQFFLDNNFIYNNDKLNNKPANKHILTNQCHTLLLFNDSVLQQYSQTFGKVTDIQISNTKYIQKIKALSF